MDVVGPDSRTASESALDEAQAPHVAKKGTATPFKHKGLIACHLLLRLNSQLVYPNSKALFSCT
jgi:hypothetical protein